MKIIIETTFTPYGKDVIINPSAPIWVLKNTGSSAVLIDNNYLMLPVESFGVDVSLISSANITAMASGLQPAKVEHQKSYAINFQPDQYAAYPGAPAFQVLLIETKYLVKK